MERFFKILGLLVAFLIAVIIGVLGVLYQIMMNGGK